MFPWLFIVYMDALMKEVKMGIRRRGVRFSEEGTELTLPGLLYAEDLFLCAEPKEDLRLMMGRFVEVCRRRELKANGSKSKGIVLNGVLGSRIWGSFRAYLEIQIFCMCFGRIRYRWSRVH